MNRHSNVPERNLSLTEELERLEQSITLTLQEIDHNFSRAHRIVTTSILPIIEQYSEHSKSVWEGSKFWKQFFEASANVSLSGYEEAAYDGEEEEDGEDTGYTQPVDDTCHSGEHEGHTPETNEERPDMYNDSLLEDTDDISGSTPRPPQMQSAIKPRFANFDSPYETLKYELKGGKPEAEEFEEENEQFPDLTPETPERQTGHRDVSMTPISSPFEPTTRLSSATQSHKPKDVLLHRVLDKTYRLAATPHSTRKLKQKSPLKPSWNDSSPMSSPPSMAPQLRSEIFSSPIRRQHKASAPRTPGISVQTPKRSTGLEYQGDHDEITWETDSDDANDVYKELGMSPPKTIQFALGPSRILQTPAREASQKIVEDLIMTAGGYPNSDGDDSPSVVRMTSNIDDSF